ncbi:MAG: TPM domain-containing protein [Undibacterium sp.]|nr:TPM domain-containing protein [Undibacterium sp.]
MNFQRIARHLLMTQWQVNRLFPRKSLLAIEQAISISENTHLGEIRFVVEGALDGTPLLKGQSARARAIDVFAQLRIWDTEHNTGVLIYLLLADRDVEIVADRGIVAKTHASEWENICHRMETAFKHGDYEDGVLNGIQDVTQQLIKHFPKAGGASDSNELSDQPVKL